MKFLADQDVYATTIRFVRSLGHDVVTAGQLGMSQAADPELLRKAHDDGRIFLTRDRDFGSLVFLQRSGPGVIYVRILPSTIHAVYAELERILTLYGDSELRDAFVVVEPGRHRIRKLGHNPSP